MKGIGGGSKLSIGVAIVGDGISQPRGFFEKCLNFLEADERQSTAMAGPS